jgi:hypothetical protein
MKATAIDAPANAARASHGRVRLELRSEPGRAMFVKTHSFRCSDGSRRLIPISKETLP